MIGSQSLHLKIVFLAALVGVTSDRCSARSSPAVYEVIGGQNPATPTGRNATKITNYIKCYRRCSKNGRQTASLTVRMNGNTRNHPLSISKTQEKRQNNEERNTVQHTPEGANVFRNTSQLSTLITCTIFTPLHRVNGHKLMPTRANYHKNFRALAATVPEI